MEKSQIWVFMEQRGGLVHEVGLELLGKARELAEATRSSLAAIAGGNREQQTWLNCVTE